MARMLPDPTFYPSPRMASEAPTETLAYVALLTNGQNGKKDALGVVDTDPSSPEYGRLVGKLELPNGGNELHHFGWNACSSHLCAYAHTSSAGISCCPGHTARAFTSSIPSPTLGSRGSSRSSREKR
jgi:hypothetical protein